MNDTQFNQLKDFAARGLKAQAACNEVIERHRQSRVINRDYVRKWALDYAKENRAHPFERVSERFLNGIESAVKQEIVARIMSHPSRGKTLM